MRDFWRGFTDVFDLEFLGAGAGILVVVLSVFAVLVLAACWVLS